MADISTGTGGVESAEVVGMVGVVGSCMLDFSVFVEKLPRAGQTVHASGPLHRGLGGKGANQAVQARLLESSVVFVGRVGDDPLGLDYMEGLKKWGLDTSFVTPTPQVMTGYASIWVGKAERSNSIVIAAGANEHLSTADVDKAFDMLAQCRVVMFQMETPMETTIHTMKRLKTEVERPPILILNTAPAPVDGVLPDEVYKFCDIICPNETEAALLSGIEELKTKEDYQAAAKTLCERGIQHVVITLGDEGCFYCAKSGEEAHIKPPVVENVVDTTGAGDSFLGAFASFLAKGDSIMDAIPKANRVAAMSVQHVGTQVSFPRLHDL